MELINPFLTVLIPLATPLLAGPGAIATILAWQQKMDDLPSIPLLVITVMAACLIVFLIFNFG